MDGVIKTNNEKKDLKPGVVLQMNEHLNYLRPVLLIIIFVFSCAPNPTMPENANTPREEEAARDNGDGGDSGKKIELLPAPPSFSLQSDNNKIVLSWSAVDEAYKYVLYRSKNNGEYAQKTEIYSFQILKYSDNDIGPDIKYAYKIKAVGSFKDGTFSAERSKTIPIVSFVPDKLSIPDARESITCSLNPMPGVDIYRVYRSTAQTGSYVNISGDIQSSSQYTDSTAQQETNYYYKCTVVSGGNESAMTESTIGKSVKYGKDNYENDSSPSMAQQISLVSVSYPSSRTQTLHSSSDLDFFHIKNSSSSSYYIKLTITPIDLNGNSAIWLRSGYSTQEVTSATTFYSASTISPGVKWEFSILNPGINSQNYEIKVQLSN